MKKLFIVFLILVFLGTISIVYLNNVNLPIRIKFLVITALTEQTQRKVSLQELKFNIFKGLVLRNLVISDAQKAILRLPEASCVFLIPPIFQRKIVIPFLNFKSPEIFLERRKDSTFNLQDLFTNKNIRPAKPGFRVIVYRVKLTDATIHFQDDTLSVPFAKDIENLDASLYLSLPASVKFRLKAEIPGQPLTDINAHGEFNWLRQQLLAKVSIRNLAPREFLAYYQNLGIAINDGLIDAAIDLAFKDGVLKLDLDTQNKNLNISKDNIKAELNSDIKTVFQYSLRDRRIQFSGNAAVADSGILGLEFVDAIKDIKGLFAFSNAGISSDSVSALVFGVPVQAKINLSNFNRPLLNLDIASSLSLTSIQNILKDKFKLAQPPDIKGNGNLSVTIQTRIPPPASLQVNGYLDISNAGLKLQNLGSPIEDISGRLEFNIRQLKWVNLNFRYLNTPYTTSGALVNFLAPQAAFKVSSGDLSIDADCSISKTLVQFSKFSGRYFNSDFRLTGDINTAALPALGADISGQLNLNLGDLKELLNKFSAAGAFAKGAKVRLEQAKPTGLIDAQFHMTGNLNDIKSCAITAKILGPSVGAYGLKGQDLKIDYNQSAGIIEALLTYLSLYGGLIKADARINLNSENLPFYLGADIQGVKLEKLKVDTALKEKDIAGAVNAQVKINGFSDDLSKLSGDGQINITEGKLWQLNLFKGLGSLLFARDFANIVFNKGSCGFTIRDKYIFSDDLKLQSNITNLAGPVKIGFDSSIDTSLNVEILDEQAPLTGTLKDLATTILGQGNRFGVIRITGTLKEPKYKFQPAVVDIIKGLKKAIFGE